MIMGKSKKEKKDKKEKKSKKSKKEKKEKKHKEKSPKDVEEPSSSSLAAPAASACSSSMAEALQFAFGGAGPSAGDRPKASAAVARAELAEQEAAKFKARHLNAASHAAALEDMQRRFAGQEAARSVAPSGEPVVEERRVTEADLNEASSKLLRAELAGETDRLPRLKANLRNLRAALERGLKIRIKRKPGSEPRPEQQLTEASSRALDGSRAPKRPRSEASPAGRESSLVDLVRHERMTSSRDSAFEFTRMHMRASMDDHFENELGTNRHDDDEEEGVARKKKKEKIGRGGEKTPRVVDKAPASNTKCPLCIDNRAKHLVLSTGESCFLTLPKHASMTSGHCYIVPLRHVSSGCHLDEDTWEEVLKFRQQVAKMVSEKMGPNSELLVLETAWSLKPHRHAFFECIPIADAEIASMATAYFKKEYSETGPRWSKNKKLIEVNIENVHRAVPRGFPYLSASFDLNHKTSYVHVIDDEKLYSDFFNREIIGGIMDVDPILWRRPPTEELNVQLQKVVNFEKMWSAFDLWNDEDQSD